ncbi:hypothetical protein VTN49DRAFT_4328 [Thermomyces lanuginosus]|uniref:uncharacterized protein n=1 Tax=Thermomyces lanuginosus TaxID=5541 RepID=UPI0037436CC8
MRRGSRFQFLTGLNGFFHVVCVVHRVPKPRVVTGHWPLVTGSGRVLVAGAGPAPAVRTRVQQREGEPKGRAFHGFLIPCSRSSSTSLPAGVDRSLVSTSFQFVVCVHACHSFSRHRLALPPVCTNRRAIAVSADPLIFFFLRGLVRPYEILHVPSIPTPGRQTTRKENHVDSLNAR